MNYRSVVHNFININFAQAEKLCEQLSLSMPAELLLNCSKYYKNQQKRDPFVDELRMLDMLLSAREREGASLALTKFFVNDAFIARTYADLLDKRGQVFGELSHPCTFAEAASTAGMYIRRARGDVRRPRLLTSIENTRDCITYPDATCVAAPNSAYRMRLLPLQRTVLCEGDVLVLISPVFSDTLIEFRRKSAKILREKEVMQYVKEVATIGRDGILYELLRMTDGVQIRLPFLSPMGTTAPVTALCESFLGSTILRVAEHRWNTVTALLSKSGVRALPFATIIKEPKFVFVRDTQSSFELDTHFLRSFNKYQAVCAKLDKESALSPSSIAFGSIGPQKNKYYASKTAKKIGDVVTIDSTSCAAVSATTFEAPYKTALWSLLAPVASLCACGVPYTNQILSLSLELPSDLSDSQTAGQCFAALLGLYRAQIELGMLTSGEPIIRTHEDLEVPNLSVWASAQGIQKPNSIFTQSGSYVYAVTPTLDKDGLPNFSLLRQMLKQITQLASEGKILSCRTLAGEAITDGILKMSDTHTCVLRDPNVAAQGKLPLCLLIESSEALPLYYIGKVYPCKPLQKTTVEIPNRTDLIACEKPDVVLVASLNDSDAMALAALLEEHGANVSLFGNSPSNAPALSRAILTTQTLILGQNAKLPESQQMDFALDTLRRAGGILLSFSQNNVCEGFIPVKSGIDEEILEKICR